MLLNVCRQFRLFNFIFLNVLILSLFLSPPFLLLFLCADHLQLVLFVIIAKLYAKPLISIEKKKDETTGEINAWLL